MLEDIKNEWKSDSYIDHLKIEKEITRTPLLHAKYLEFYLSARAKKSGAVRKLNTMKNTKRRYYRGEMNKVELDQHEWEQWQGLKPSNAEMNQLFEMDSDLNQLEGMIDYWDTCISTVEYIMRAISSRNYDIKSMIEYRKFEAGG